MRVGNACQDGASHPAADVTNRNATIQWSKPGEIEMSNPLSFFRKNQKVLLAVFGVALMIVFTVGGIVGNSGQQAPEVTNDVVVRMKGETIRESDLQRKRMDRTAVIQFLLGLHQVAVDRGATPRQFGQSIDGIPTSIADVSLVETEVLVNEAEKQGFFVTDDYALHYLDTFCSGVVTRDQFSGILKQATSGRYSQSQFLNALRWELTAVVQRGAFFNGILPSTPGQAWDYYQRLNRRVAIAAVPFAASEYVSQVSEPSSGEIRELYEKGKDQFQRNGFAEPGFRRRPKVAIEYIKVDLQPELERQMAAITPQQVQDYYDTHKEQFLEISLPSDDLIDSLEGDSDDSADDSVEDNASSTVEETEATESTPDSESQPSENTEEASDSPGESDSSLIQDFSTLPASFQEEDSAAADDASDTLEDQVEEVTESVEPETDASELADQDQADSTETADDLTEDTAAETQTDDADTSTETDSTESDSAAGDNQDAEASETPDQDTVDQDTAAGTDDETNILDDLPDAPGPVVSAPRYKPLSEVEEDIRRDIASPLARTEVDRIRREASGKMKEYFGEYLMWANSPDKDEKDQPSPPSLSTIAAASDALTAGKVPLVDAQELMDVDRTTKTARYEIAQAFTTDGVFFAQAIFEPGLRNYHAGEIKGMDADTEFLYWKTDSEDGYVPTLEQCREEVIQVAKQQKALELAQKAAEEARNKVKASGKTLSEYFADMPNKTVVDSGLFSWMNSGGMAYGMQPQISQVPGVEYAGNDFMASVFALSDQQIGTAVNNPETVVYLVQVTQEETDPDKLRQSFLEFGLPPEVTIIGIQDLQRRFQYWWTSEVQGELGLTWERAADN
ncbi:MAG: SurA N-terminal domain-containing protein [Planctomycetales bacterium]|nr:SurA N-terminal domain-containing protein [Planctomycetales bacterium]